MTAPPIEVITTIIIGGPSLVIAVLTWLESRRQRRRIDTRYSVGDIESGIRPQLSDFITTPARRSTTPRIFVPQTEEFEFPDRAPPQVYSPLRRQSSFISISLDGGSRTQVWAQQVDRPYGSGQRFCQ